ncbi:MULTISPECIES: LGFP repeat-containing protein [unclassified Nocardia]|uniref:LGFP repeat-containing protein n=1 Tax=unclassified Nocardia TaxID=2637762 RepID=UPI001CE45F6D|nr:MULTISPECIES: hypothetical protein [unclassified Nocardia]
MVSLRPRNRSTARGALAVTAAAAVLTTVAGTAAARPIGPFDVGGAIEVKYDQLGGGAFFGDPTSAELDAAAGGRFQTFERGGAIYWRGDVDAHQVGGAIQDKWRGLAGESGVLGFPVTDEQSTPRNPGRYNHFQGGSVYWSVGTGAHQIGGAIRDKWAAYGWESGPLGFPISDEASAANNKGRYNLFPGGAIYWSARTGAHVVWGAIRDNWALRGGENGSYGFPTSDEYDYNGGKAQDFQGGRITWTP